MSTGTGFLNFWTTPQESQRPIAPGAEQQASLADQNDLFNSLFGEPGDLPLEGAPWPVHCFLPVLFLRAVRPLQSPGRRWSSPMSSI